MATSILPVRKERGPARVRMCNRPVRQEVLVPAKTAKTTWYPARWEGRTLFVLRKAS
jgi:hypothetical protein